MSETEKTRSVAGLTLGIVGLFTWFLPIVGLPISVVGLVLSYRKHYTPGVVMNIIGLALTLINASIGAYIGATRAM